MSVSVPALSGKDIDDLKFARSLGVDLIALSFVRSAADVDLARAVMDEVGAADRPVIAELESPKRLRISRPPPGLSCRTRGTACARRAAMVGRQALQPISEAWSWQLDTACRGMPSAPFFHPWNERGSVREDRIGQGKHSLCSGCPVIDTCRRHALQAQEMYGIWGGLSDDARSGVAQPPSAPVPTLTTPNQPGGRPGRPRHIPIPVRPAVDRLRNPPGPLAVPGSIRGARPGPAADAFGRRERPGRRSNACPAVTRTPSRSSASPSAGIAPTTACSGPAAN